LQLFQSEKQEGARGGARQDKIKFNSRLARHIISVSNTHVRPRFKRQCPSAYSRQRRWFGWHCDNAWLEWQTRVGSALQISRLSLCRLT
jgi:hypothetical protein